MWPWLNLTWLNSKAVFQQNNKFLRILWTFALTFTQQGNPLVCSSLLKEGSCIGCLLVWCGFCQIEKVRYISHPRRDIFIGTSMKNSGVFGLNSQIENQNPLLLYLCSSRSNNTTISTIPMVFIVSTLS